MVRSQLHLAMLIAVAIATGCTAGSNAEYDEQNARTIAADGDAEECTDCIQPPLRRADLVDHLKQNQERILARDDYKYNIPPPVSEIIYGPLPDEHLRDGSPVVDDDGSPFDGELNWHHIDFDEIATDEVDDAALRGRDVSGAHCYFAHRPNKETAIFSLLVRHDAGGDALYTGGPYHRVNPIDDGPSESMQVRTDHIWCAFRHDQNRLGALIVAYISDDDASRFAVFTVVTGASRQPTGETKTVERPAHSSSREVVRERVPVKKYPNLDVEFLDSFDDLYGALSAADEAIPPGPFRLWPSSIYPTMTRLPHIHGAEDHFCPARVECTERREHFPPDMAGPPPANDEESDEVDGEDRHE